MLRIYELLLCFLDYSGHLGFEIVVQNLLFHDRVEQARVRGVYILVESFFEFANLLDWQIVEDAAGSGKDDQNLLGERQRRELALLQQFDQALAAIELLLRGLVEIAAELGEGRQFAVLRQFELQRSGDLAHGLDLRAAADAAYGKSDVHGRTDALVEQIGFEIDLAVGDGNDVGRNVGRNVAGLRFDYRQRGQRSAAVLVAQLGGALQQARVEIENVSGIGFAARRTAQQKRDFAVGRGVLGKIVVDAERVASAIAEEFAHGAGGIGRDVLHGRGFGGRGGDDDGVFHGAGVFENLDDLRDRGALLADGVVDADQVVALAVDDGVEGDGGFAGLAVADDQFALAAADGDHRVDGFETGGHGLAHGLAVDDAGSDALERNELVGLDRALCRQWARRAS